MLCCLLHSLLHAGHTDAPAPAQSNESLADILKRRYALGEITQLQFEQMKRALGLSEAIADQRQ